MRTMAHDFSSRGAEVTIIGPTGLAGLKKGDAGERVVNVPNSDSSSKWPRLVKQSAVWLASARAIRRLDPEPDVLLLVASLSSALGLRTLLLKSLCQKPLAVYITGLAKPRAGYRWGMSADRVLVINEYIQEWFPDAVVIPPFLPIHLSRNGATLERIDNTFKILFLGSFEPVRGVEYLLQALSIIKENMKRPVQLIMAWNGAGADNYDNIQQLIDSLGVRSMVDLRGEVDTNHVYREADILVIPRASGEKMAHPLRIPEAIHMHKPLVVTRICGMENHLEGCGLSVEPRDADALAQAILRLANDVNLLERLTANCTRVDKQLASRIALDDLFNALVAISGT